MAATFALAALGTLGGCEAATPPPAALAPGEHTVTTDDGLRVVYHVAGAGPPCLVHPGGPGMGWTYLRMPLLERQLTLVYIEPTGTGASSPLTEVPRSLARRHAEDLEAVRRALRLDRVCLIGHSYGGGVALRYAIEHGAHLAALVLYSASAVTDAEWGRSTDVAEKSFAGEPWFARRDAQLATPLPPPAFVNECTRLTRLAPFYFADYTGRHQELDAVVRGFRCWPRPTEVAKEKLDDLRPELGELAAPTLVITGRRDWLFGPRWAQATANAILDARVVVLEHSGHFGHLEEPEAFAAAVGGFVRSALAAPR